MMSIFTKQRKIPRPAMRVSMHDDDTESVDDLLPSVFDDPDERPRKLRKQSKRASLPTPSSHSTSRDHDIEDPYLTAPAKEQAKGDSSITLGIAEAIYDPNYYTTLLLQASDARYKSQSSPSTPPPSPSRSASSNTTYASDGSPRTSPSTPVRQSSFHARVSKARAKLNSSNRNLSLSRKAKRGLDPILEGVTYDAILTSTLNKTLARHGECENRLDPPLTQVPPNTPARDVVQDGGFASLMCLSVAIMEGKLGFADAMAY